jgi:hypothetical protein
VGYDRFGSDTVQFVRQVSALLFTAPAYCELIILNKTFPSFAAKFLLFNI